MFTFGVAVADYVIKVEKFLPFSELWGGVLRETSLLDIFALFVVLFSIFFCMNLDSVVFHWICLDFALTSGTVSPNTDLPAGE